jgi:Tol biopolymer transport system component
MSRREGNWDIFVANADGSNPIRVSTNPGDDGLPTWSPDGNVIAFVSQQAGEWAIWVTLPTGEDQRQLFKMEGPPEGYVGANRNASRGWTEERISWTQN